ncbi:histidine phosphatase family protein [Amycolatopsis azurea]|uniref:Histidine phosphatase family protein n=1 Tax=Amycolatopsis azurea DSM 43854 TaxID=1238180 RepID=M2NQM9_9PSEU|nr:histidine phosphatase family protein [Amycolatopsis azurea]EMD24594.1 Phosphoglycerate mutase [Amycolatopsis azurea DSM 43854]OOC02074.1 histidine phosphatase family protein [Amycolatopsis azurea DSM 43854]
MGAIYLVRHGQASFGAENYDQLSPRGFEQSTVVGEELLRRGVDFTQARAGSLARQRDTAATALKVLGSGIAVVEDERWNEYDHVDIAKHHADGARQNDSRAYQSALDGALSAWVEAGASGPCAETWPRFLDRVRGALADVVASLGKGEHAVVFSSGGVIATVCGALMGTPEAGLLKLNRVTVNAGITKLVSGRGGVTLLSFNEHPHFEAEAAKLLTYR